MGLLYFYSTGFGSEAGDQWDRQSQREYEAFFTSECDENYVRQNIGFQINQIHPTDNGQVVQRIKVDVDKESGLHNFQNPSVSTDSNNGLLCYRWIAVIFYGSWNPIDHTPDGNPTNQQLAIDFDWQPFEVPVDLAITGKNDDGSYIFSPVVNSAGDPYDPPVTRESRRGIIRVVQNSLSFNPYTLFQYGDYINNDTWNGFPPHSVKFSPPKMPERPYSQFLGQNYYRLAYEFVFNPYGWNAKPIDRGFRYLSGGHAIKILDYLGNPVSQPILLDGAGGVLAPGNTDYVTFDFQLYYDISFTNVFGPVFANLFPTA